MTIRRAALAAAAALAGLAGLSVAATPTADAAPSREAAKTTITFQVPGCDGCQVQLMQARWKTGPGHGIRFWHTAERTVDGDSLSFTVPTRHTHGMSMTVVAPWEGNTGYVTTTAFRYGGEDLGDDITFRQARSKHMATACWAGTSADEVTIPLTVRKVWVDGTRHRVRGSIAYASTTQEWMVPMREVWHGVLGSQDVNVCGKQPRG